MAHATIKPTIIRLLREYKQRLNAENISIDQMILFGSQTKGAKPWSDIDVAIVSKNLGKDSVDEYVTLRRLSRDIDLRIEPHPFSPQDFSVEEDPFAFEIRRTGIPV